MEANIYTAQLVVHEKPMRENTYVVVTDYRPDYFTGRLSMVCSDSDSQRLESWPISAALMAASVL